MEKKMSDKVYLKLREHIDKMPAGYSKTESGADIKMLKKFYTERQAQIALMIGPKPETAEAIAKRIDMDKDVVIEEIKTMALEGSLFRVTTPNGPLFCHPNFIMGLYEWHVNSVDKEVAELSDDIYDSLFENHWKGRKTKQLRVVPVPTSIDAKSSVKSYDIIRDLVKGPSEGPYAVAPCICRVEQIKKGNEVDRPMETCIVFGLVAQYYIENSIGKALTVDQLMDKIDECEAASLVPFSTNSKEIVNMCMCDKDSCQLFRNLRTFPKPAEEVHAAFYASIDNDSCIGCKKCTTKCQIDAIVPTDVSAGKKTFKHQVDIERCIGCGLCVSHCKQNALTMVEKDILPDVPENALEMNMRIAKERSELGV
jgi:electron transport complex protein RnfB